jgi:hypothetical protein
VLPAKDEVIAALLDRARQEHASLAQVMRMAQDEATSDETKAEGKYDTRATEASYLAAGQGERVAQLARAIAWLDACHGAGPPFYVLEGARGLAGFLLAPEGGGQRARVGALEVVVLTVRSPLGQALVGAREGDVVEVGEGSAAQAWEVVAVR